MTVAELIDLLQKAPGGLPVFVRGYENGVDGISGLAQIAVRPSRNPEWWDGKYEHQMTGQIPDGWTGGILIEPEEHDA